MHLLLAFAYIFIILQHIHPLVAFSTIFFTIFISVKRSNFTLVFLKAVYHANAEDERQFAGSSSYILIHLFLKFSNTSANNNVSF